MGLGYSQGNFSPLKKSCLSPDKAYRVAENTITCLKTEMSNFIKSVSIRRCVSMSGAPVTACVVMIRATGTHIRGKHTGNA